MLVAFRSIVVLLKAIALSLLSVGASYGMLALVFQHRSAEAVLGFHSNGTIVSWLPLCLFVVLFGLSMDKLLGERNWYLPRWLERKPRFEPEEPIAAPEAPPVPASA